ncbi:MAG: hypothetical protein ACOYL5_17920 [Phototrophicaceae bacterium]|jgi:CRISPR/Cas system-associated exonuclease Cas4 (RecB family)
MEIPDYLPLSFLNQLAYCPRRFWLMFCQSEMEINASVETVGSDAPKEKNTYIL